VASGIGIGYVDGPRLRRSLLAGADWVAAGREDLNRLNVFPIPDGDTGTNLCLTLGAVARALRPLSDAPLPRVTAAMAQASVRGAHGNSGMLLSQFLLGLGEGLGDRDTAAAGELAYAIRLGFERLQGSLDEPVEGTMLTVARAAADEAARAGGERDLRVFMRRLVSCTEQALARTPDLLAVLKTAGVVDAGAKGFVRLLDGVKRLIEDGHRVTGAVEHLGPDAARDAELPAERDLRFCTEVVVRGPALPASDAVRAALRRVGSSIVVLQTADLLKAHVHTDTPDAVFALGAEWGVVESTKAEDMRAQRRALQAKRAVAVVTDTACDLPDEVVVAHSIGLVPMQLILGDRVYRDRAELTPSEFFAQLRAGSDATTSQPAPTAFAEAYADALRQGEHVIAVVVSKALSGTYASAEAAARRLDPSGDRITVVDSGSASLGEGLLALRGIELAEQGWLPGAIVRELARVRNQSGGLFTVDNLARLVRSGRVGRVAAWLGTKLDVKPVMAILPNGTVHPVARARGTPAARRRLLEHLDRALAGDPRELRLGIVHADLSAVATALQAELVARYRPKQCLVSPITPVLAAHAGIGAWGVFYQIEDGTNTSPGRYD
jgi:uncharacterized protein